MLPPDERELRSQVERSLAEDLGEGDLTSLAVLEEAECCRAQIVARAKGVVCGLPLAVEVFRQLDERILCRALAEDGDQVAKGASLLELSGPARGILAGERTALNFLQHLSGVASLSRLFVEAAAPFQVDILDTRKTLPGLRQLEKYATRVGGARNHRMGLYDAILVKDNHATVAGGLGVALGRARRSHPGAEIEAEVRDLSELDLALEFGVGRVLLDNFSPQSVTEAVARAAGRAQVEVSGGVTMENLRDFAAARPDYISVGRLTHSAPALDLALEVSAD